MEGWFVGERGIDGGEGKVCWIFWYCVICGGW